MAPGRPSHKALARSDQRKWPASVRYLYSPRPGPVAQEQSDEGQGNDRESESRSTSSKPGSDDSLSDHSTDAVVSSRPDSLETCSHRPSLESESRPPRAANQASARRNGGEYDRDSRLRIISDLPSGCSPGTRSVQSSTALLRGGAGSASEGSTSADEDSRYREWKKGKIIRRRKRQETKQRQVETAREMDGRDEGPDGKGKLPQLLKRWAAAVARHFLFHW